MKKININKIYCKGLLFIMAMLSYDCAWGQSWTDTSESYSFYADSTFTYIDSDSATQTRTVRFYYNITSTDADNPTLELTYKTISPHMNGSSFQYNENGAAADPDATGVSGYNGYIRIPDTVVHNDGTGIDTTYTVTGVGYRAFEGCYNITAFYIPATITYIGAKAFYVRSNSHSYIDSVTLEDNSQLTSIGDSAFYRMDYNESFDAGEFAIPEGVTTIGASAFYQSRFSHITIPSTVTNIGDAAFEQIASLTWLKIGCEDIPEECFKSCSSLKTLIITDNVKTIQYDAFTSDKNLETVYSQSMTPATCVGKNNGSGTVSSFEECKTCWLVVPEDAAFNYDTKYTTNDDQGYYEGTKCDIEDWSDIGYQMREDTVTIKITTPEGYVTHYSPYTYILQRGLTGGVITDADSYGKLTIDWCYSAGDTIPAGTAILLKGPINSVDTTFANPTINTDETLNPKPDKNMMFGTVITAHEYDGTSNNASYGNVNYKDDTTQNSSYYYYKLSYYTDEYGNRSLGFYWCDEQDLATNESAGGQFSVDGGNTYSSGVKLAWLTIPTSTFTNEKQAKMVYYPLEENVTGIQMVDAVKLETQCSDVIYNIQGMRVKDMTKKGIYIVNGKKILR